MIYFDSAATSLYKPDAVYDAVLHAMKTAGNADRGVNEASISASEMIFDTRMKLADLFGFSDPTRVAFCHNATEALNTAIKGLVNYPHLRSAKRWGLLRGGCPPRFFYSCLTGYYG